MPTDPQAASVAASGIVRGSRMKESEKLMHRRRVCLSFLLLAAITVAARAQTTPDFSGLWKQDNDRCQPKRSGDVRLRIEHHEPELTVETSISRDSQSSRHAVQKYTTDGKISISTGADGDEFHTSVAWKDASLVFSIEEHEDGRILLLERDMVAHRGWRNPRKEARAAERRKADSFLSPDPDELIGSQIRICKGA